MPGARHSHALPPLDAVAVNATLIAVRQAAHVLCDRTTLLMTLHALAGACRYADFHDRTGLASRLLSSRLEQLQGHGIVVPIAYSRRPLRHEYYLTHMGLALFDVMALAAAWEHTWHGHQGVDVVIDHVACGGTAVGVEQHCSACDGSVAARDIQLRVNQRGINAMPDKSTAMRRSTQGLHRAGRAPPAVPLPHALEVLGDKWTIEIIVGAFLRLHLFGEFGSHTGIASNILADRLQRLLRLGMLERAAEAGAYPKGAYLLTDKGRAFYPILTAIQSWADTWLAHRVRSPVKLLHAPCGHLLRPRLICAHCRQPIDRAGSRFVIRAAGSLQTAPA